MQIRDDDKNNKKIRMRELMSAEREYSNAEIFASWIRNCGELEAINWN